MSASLEALISFIREKYTICEISGGGGYVKWISQIEDPAAAGDLQPGTLAVTAGLLMKESPGVIDELIGALVEARSAGLIITADITPNDKSLPIFRMPVGTKLPALIYDCSHFLMRQESKELTVVKAMKSILTGSAQNDAALRYLEQHGFPSMSKYYLLCFDKEVGGAQRSEGAHSCMFRYNDSTLSIICTSDQAKCEEFAKSADPDGMVGVSDVFQSPDELPKAYRQALSAMKTAEMTGKGVIFYNRAGIFTLMRSICTSKEAKDFADDLLRPISDFDSLNRTDYLNTLRAYIKCSGSVQDTADQLGIHRNTVNNKIRFIKDNFGLSFDYAGIAAISAALAIKELAKAEKGEI